MDGHRDYFLGKMLCLLTFILGNARDYPLLAGEAQEMSNQQAVILCIVPGDPAYIIV